MKNVLVQIGEHIVSISSTSEKLMDWIKTHFQIAEGNHVAKIKSPNLSIHIEGNYGVSFVDYNVEICSDSDKITYQRADYLINVNSIYNEATISVYDELALKHALHNLYSAFIIHNRWGLLIHSSCVDHEGKAYLFSGQSGAGKSTVAKLSAPRPLLSDEATIVKIDENEIRVFDSPFRSELTTSYAYQSCHLSSIYLLIQSLDVKALPVKKSDAMLGIMDKVFYWHHDSLETAKLLDMCKQLVDKIPVYKMYFQKNDSFWELIS
ncbi:hypothetical protein ACFQZ1_21060 [Bacillus sp. CGMCC 1.60114]|uniref:hypothetical protein n=1 Tax=unclassified Bacillus (in: firmicutes) TaxID=185979 RepID=UPI0036310C00